MIEQLYSAKTKARSARMAADALVGELESAIRALDTIEGALRTAGARSLAHKDLSIELKIAKDASLDLSILSFSGYHDRVSEVLNTVTMLRAEN